MGIKYELELLQKKGNGYVECVKSAKAQWTSHIFHNNIWASCCVIYLPSNMWSICFSKPPAHMFWLQIEDLSEDIYHGWLDHFVIVVYHYSFVFQISALMLSVWLIRDNIRQQNYKACNCQKIQWLPKSLRLMYNKTVCHLVFTNISSSYVAFFHTYNDRQLEIFLWY